MMIHRGTANRGSTVRLLLPRALRKVAFSIPIMNKGATFWSPYDIKLFN